MTGTFYRTLRPFGARFHLQADDRRVLRACEAALVHFPAEAGVAADLRLDVVTSPDTADDPAWPHTKGLFENGTLDLWCGSAHLQTKPAVGTAHLTIPPALLALPDAVRMFVEGAVSSLLISGGHLRAIHSALVGVKGRGLLLRGPSGAGKSTLTYAGLRRGFTVSSDDWVYSVVGRPPDRLWGYPWRMFLVPEAVAHFPEVAALDPVLHPGADRLKLPVEPPPSRRRRQLAIDAVVFLDPAPELAWRPAQPGEAQDRFWSVALPSEKTDLDPAFVEKLLDRPCFVLQRGTDPHTAAAALEDLARTALS